MIFNNKGAIQNKSGCFLPGSPDLETIIFNNKGDVLLGDNEFIDDNSFSRSQKLKYPTIFEWW